MMDHITVQGQGGTFSLCPTPYTGRETTRRPMTQRPRRLRLRSSRQVSSVGPEKPTVDNRAMHLSAKSSALTILLAEVAAESALHPEVAGLQRDGCIRG